MPAVTAEQTLPGSMPAASRDNHESWPPNWTQGRCGKGEPAIWKMVSEMKEMEDGSEMKEMGDER